MTNTAQLTWSQAYYIATEMRRHSEAESCQLISDMIRERIEAERIRNDADSIHDYHIASFVEQLIRERDEAREAARILHKESMMFKEGLARWPWLKDSPGA